MYNSFIMEINKKEIRKVVYTLTLSPEEMNILANLGNYYRTVAKSVTAYEDIAECGDTPTVEDAECLLVDIYNLVKPV